MISKARRKTRGTGSTFVEFNNMVTPYTARLFEAVNAAGDELAILSCTAREPNRAWGEVRPRFRHIVLPGRSFLVGPRRYAHLNRRIIRTLSSLRPNALVVTGLYPSMLVAAMWAWASRTPMALRMDGGAADMPTSLAHRLVRSFILARSRAVVTCGRKGYDYFRSQGVPPERLHVVPLIPAWDARPEPAPLQQRSYDLLWVAELDDSMKNISHFRDVVIALHRRRPNLRVRLVGHGKEGAAVLAALRQESVDFHHDSAIHWSEMGAVFSSARLFMLPSRREPWGLVCNEAMQCGTPCIVSPMVGAADDLVTNENGRIVPLDVEAWAIAADSLLEDEALWDRLSSRAHADARARTITNSAQIYRNMLLSLVQGADRGQRAPESGASRLLPP